MAIQTTHTASRPTFSVVIPTFNRAAMVTQAVLSVLNQTHSDYELIVVDDGSGDDTREALAQFGDRIRYVYQDNAGVAAARNRGIAESSGDFVAFLDSDDLFEPRMLEEALRTFERHPDAGVVFTPETELDAADLPYRVVTKKSPGVFFSPVGMISTDTHIGSGRPGIVRRELLERSGGFDVSLGCAIDCDLWIRLSFHTPMVLQPEPLVLRRWHSDNLSADMKQDAQDWLHILEKVERDQPEFVRDHGRTYRMAVARNHLRYGREIMAGETEPGSLELARRSLRRSIRLRPAQVRAYVYLVSSYVVPQRLFRRWRSWERRHLTAEGRKSSATGTRDAGFSRRG
jgi:glycosyltransferase involved in cell wall biosynthesis